MKMEVSDVGMKPNLKCLGSLISGELVFTLFLNDIKLEKMLTEQEPKRGSESSIGIFDWALR